MSCVDFPQVQYIDLSQVNSRFESCHFCSSEHLNLSATFMVSHSLIAIRFPWMEVKSRFQDPEKVSLSPEKR